MNKGDIVSVVAMSGEYIGELVDNKDGIELANPKMIVRRQMAVWVLQKVWQ